MKLPYKRLRRWAVALCVLAALGWAGNSFYRLYRAQAAVTVASAPARQGDFLVIVRCRGELRARRSVQIAAPAKVPSLRIVWMAPPGSTVKAGDPVVRFDPSSARQQLQQNEAALKQAQATLEQSIAQSRITAEQDKRDLATARYTLERAGLEVSKAEIVSRLKAEESTVDLGVAKQGLNVQDATVALHLASDKARMASLTRLRDKAQAEVNITKARLEQMEVKTPIAGLVTYLPNYSQGWINAKQFKIGDQVWPGAALGEIPDLSTLEMEGKIEEIERGRIVTGQDARVRIDSLPELSLPAKIDSISPLTQMDFSDWNTRNFIGHAPIRQADPRLRPGMNGGMDVVVSRVPNAIAIPAKALFTREGKPIVYLAAQGQVRPVEVEVLARNPDEVAVKGIPAKAMVALAEPDGKERRK